MHNRLLPNTWDKFHHAYLLSGAFPTRIWEELLLLGFKQKGNPDAKNEEFETLGIDEARALSDWAITRPIGGERKVLVASAGSFTSEAQNALLKLFEEPPQGTYFFVILSNIGSVLPTLLSRARVINAEGASGTNKKNEGFLKGDIAERLKIISPIIKSKDKERARSLVRQLEYEIASMTGESNKFQKAEKILRAERYLTSRGSSLKMILEYLALSL